MTSEGQVDQLATALLSEDQDITDIYEALQSLMGPKSHNLLGLKLELCPVHFCDIQICIDDQIHGDEVYNVQRR